MDSIHETGDEREDTSAETKSERERAWVLETLHSSDDQKHLGREDVRGTCILIIMILFSFLLYYIPLAAWFSVYASFSEILRLDLLLYPSNFRGSISHWQELLTPLEPLSRFYRQVTLVLMWTVQRHFTIAQIPAQRHLWFWKAFCRPHNSTIFLLIFDSWDKPAWTAFGSN